MRIVTTKLFLLTSSAGDLSCACHAHDSVLATTDHTLINRRSGKPTSCGWQRAKEGLSDFHSTPAYTNSTQPMAVGRKNKFGIDDLGHFRLP
eukprot:5193508-Amphidinium_carterae.1